MKTNSKCVSHVVGESRLWLSYFQQYYHIEYQWELIDNSTNQLKFDEDK